MSRYRRAHIPGARYFFTLSLYDRQAAFLIREPVRFALRQAVITTRRRFPFIIDAWVLLPDHLHCIWTLPEGDDRFALRWSLIKRTVTKSITIVSQKSQTASRLKRNESNIWQRRFWEHWIRDDGDFERHCDYIHWNPVKHGYVRAVRDWPWSTFHRFVREGHYPENWGVSSIRAWARAMVSHAKMIKQA